MIAAPGAVANHRWRERAVVRSADGTAKSDRTTRQDPGSPLLLAATKEASSFVSGGVVVASGVAQATVNGAGRVALVIVCLTAAAFLLIRVLQIGVGRKRRRGERHPYTADDLANVPRYKRALRRIASLPRLEDLTEEVELIISVGDHDRADVVTEKRLTAASPALICRVIKPIRAYTSEPVSYDALDLTIESARDDVQVVALPLAESLQEIVVLALFQSDAIGPVPWQVTYEAPGLWGPLRENGADVLRWVPQISERWNHPGRLVKLTVQFILPMHVAGITVSERHGRGRQRFDVLQTGEKRVTWIDDAPSDERYVWDLTGIFQ